jgi:Flp pilus assembly protein TadD
MHPAGYHAVNVALHAVGAVVLWRALRRLAVPGAWLAALIFAVHPVTVASVAWITELKNTLSLPLLGLAILSHLRFEDTRRRRWYAVSLGVFALALLTKASVVVLPAVLLLIAWWRRGRIAKGDWLGALPFFALSAVSAGVTIWFQHNRAISNPVDGPADVMERLALAGKAVWFYLGKAYWPVNLSMIYPRWNVAAPGVWSFAPLLAALLAAGVLVRYRRGWARPAAFALGYCLLGLLPVLGFVDMSFMVHSFVADHWHYLSLIGAIALPVGLAWHWAAGAGKVVRAAGVVAAVAAVICFSTLTYARAGVFRDETSLWTDTLAKNPRSWSAHNSLAIALAKDGLRTEAAEHYRQAIGLNPRYFRAYNNLGNLLADLGDLEGAIQCHRESLRLNPGYANAHNGLGIVLEKNNQFEQAEQEYGQAILLDPKDMRARFNLGMLQARTNRPAAAVRTLREAASLRPLDKELQRRVREALAAIEAASRGGEPSSRPSNR